MKKLFALVLISCFSLLSNQEIQAQRNMGYAPNSTEGGFRVARNYGKRSVRSMNYRNEVNGFNGSRRLQPSNSVSDPACKKACCQNTHKRNCCHEKRMCQHQKSVDACNSECTSNVGRACCKAKRMCAHERQYQRNANCHTKGCSQNDNCKSSCNKQSCSGARSSCSKKDCSKCDNKTCSTKQVCNQSSKKACCKNKANCSKKCCAKSSCSKSNKSQCNSSCKKACCSKTKAKTCRPNCKKQCCRKKPKRKNSSRYNRY